MADERDPSENEPRIKIVDRRMLSDDERAGKADLKTENSAPAPIAPAAAEEERPRLEMIGGGLGSSSLHESPGSAVSAPIAGDAADATETVPASQFEGAEGYELDEEAPLSDEEAAQLRQQVEEEQFAALEQQVGRPLTEREKDAVRGEMDKQVKSMSALEVAPILVQVLPELSARAAVHLGLMPNPYTRLIARNDTEARLAIDAFGALFEVIKPRLDARSSAEYSRVLNDLRVNFAQITGIPITGNAGAPRIIR